MYISFCAISVELFRLNTPICCSPSVDLIYFSNRGNTEYRRSVCNVHKNTKSIFRDDHRQKQPENFLLK